MKGWVKEKDFLMLKEQMRIATNIFLANSRGSTKDRQLQIDLYLGINPDAKSRYLTIEEVPTGFHPGIWEDQDRRKNLDITRIAFL